MKTSSKKQFLYLLFAVTALVITLFVFAFTSSAFNIDDGVETVSILKSNVALANDNYELEQNKLAILTSDFKSYESFYNATVLDFENLLNETTTPVDSYSSLRTELQSIESDNLALKNELSLLEAKLK